MNCVILGCYKPQRIKQYCDYHYAVQQEYNALRCQQRKEKYTELEKKYKELQQKYLTLQQQFEAHKKYILYNRKQL